MTSTNPEPNTPEFEAWKKMFGFVKFVDSIGDTEVKSKLGSKFLEFIRGHVLPKQQAVGAIIDIPSLVLSYIGIEKSQLSREDYAKLIRYFHAFCELAEL